MGGGISKAMESMACLHADGADHGPGVMMGNNCNNNHMVHEILFSCNMEPKLIHKAVKLMCRTRGQKASRSMGHARAESG